MLEFARQQASEGHRRLAQAALCAFAQEDQPHAYNAIGHASLNEDDPDTAAWAADLLGQFQAEDFPVRAALLRSEVAMRRGDFAAAAREAEEVVRIEGQCSRGHEQLGRALLLAGEWDRAVDEMIEALHHGQGGALAAGVAALAAIEVRDLASARGIFLAQRCGDGLACAASHTAQARLLGSEGNFREAMQVGEWALQELEQLPAWARQPAVIQRLTGALCEALQMARDSGDEEQRGAADELLERLGKVRQQA